MKQKKLMIVGATWAQVPLVKKAKELGCEVVASAPCLGADGFACADHAEVVDSSDFQKVIYIVRN